MVGRLSTPPNFFTYSISRFLYTDIISYSYCMDYIFECTIELESGITITEIISASSSLQAGVIVTERFGYFSKLLYIKALF